MVGMGGTEVQRVVESDLAAVPYVVGVNNHMGSRATQDGTLMAEVMEALADHHLYFIDSRTTAASVALEVARGHHLPAFYRTVFLDDTETVEYTLGQLRDFRRTVEHEGVALAIGHPHATTITALEEFLPEFESADIELVTPSQIVRLPEVAKLHPATHAALEPSSNSGEREDFQGGVKGAGNFPAFTIRVADLLPEDFVIDMKVAIVREKRHEKTIVVACDSANQTFGLQHEQNLFAKVPNLVPSTCGA